MGRNKFHADFVGWYQNFACVLTWEMKIYFTYEQFVISSSDSEIQKFFAEHKSHSS